MNNLLTTNEISDIQEILMTQLDVSRDQLTDDAAIQADLGADSLDVVEIGMRLEDRFDLTIPDDAWERVERVADLYDAVTRLRASGHGTSE